MPSFRVIGGVAVVAVLAAGCLTDECRAGAQRCNGSVFQYCIQYDHGGTEWSAGGDCTDIGRGCPLAGSPDRFCADDGVTLYGGCDRGFGVATTRQVCPEACVVGMGNTGRCSTLAGTGAATP